MNKTATQKQIITGVLLAVLTALIWSGNFVLARGISGKVPPLTLAFYRWFAALISLIPFAWKKFIHEWPVMRKNMRYMCITAFAGFTMYNVCLYVAGHFTSAINLALIGSTSAPIFAVIIGVLMFKEKTTWLRIIGMAICFAGIVLLISQGSWQRLVAFRFSSGDLWTLAGSLSFAFYNNLAKHKPQGISSINFLFTGFLIASILLFPASLIELNVTHIHVSFTKEVIGAVLYLSVGCSSIGYFIWNRSIQLIGPGRTVLFGNLIPVFSIIEAVILLNETFTTMHLISGLVVMTGLVIANMNLQRAKL